MRLRSTHPTASSDSTVKQPLLFRHASSPLLFAARGRRRRLHSRPLARGRAERRVPDAPLGLMPMRSSASWRIRTFGKHGRWPDVPPAVFCRLAECLPKQPIKVTLVWPCATGPGERSSWAGRVSNLVVRHLICGPVPPASKPSRLSQWYPDHRRCGLPADSRYPHIP